MAAAAAVVLTPTMAQAAGSVNSSADHLAVRNDNIENMPVPACGMDFNKLINYIKSRPTSPDVFTVQQISNVTQLTALTRRMTDEPAGDVRGRDRDRAATGDQRRRGVAGVSPSFLESLQIVRETPGDAG